MFSLNYSTEIDTGSRRKNLQEKNMFSERRRRLFLPTRIQIGIVLIR